jgi:hypothetical protein
LDAKTGEKIWSYKTGADVESFTSVANGVVYIGSNDYYIYAIGAIASQQPASPSSTVPEFSWLAILSLFLSMLFIAVKLRHRKPASLSNLLKLN